MSTTSRTPQTDAPQLEAEVAHAATLLALFTTAVERAEASHATLTAAVAAIRSTEVDKTTGPRISAEQGAHTVRVQAIVAWLKGQRSAARAACAAIPESEQVALGTQIDALERRWEQAARLVSIESLLGLKTLSRAVSACEVTETLSSTEAVEEWCRGQRRRGRGRRL